MHTMSVRVYIKVDLYTGMCITDKLKCTVIPTFNCDCEQCALYGNTVCL